MIAPVRKALYPSDYSPVAERLRRSNGAAIKPLRNNALGCIGLYKALEPAEVTFGVVIVNYNSGGDLLRCLHSLEDSSVRPHTIVVVDNNSDDGSIEQCDKFDGVVVIRKSANVGYACAVNAGINAIPSCTWVAVLNPDVFVRRNWLAELQRAVHRFPQARAFASRMINHNRPDMLDGEGDVYHLSGLAWRHHHGSGIDNAEKISRPTFSACGGAALYHRQTFVELNGYDEDFFCYMEDVDLGWRLQLAGHDCIYVHEAEVEHIGSSTCGDRSDFQIYYGHRNMVWTWVKNMPWPLMVACFPYHVLANLMTVVVYCCRGKASVVLRAKKDALAGLPRAYRKRREVQALRARSRRALWRVLDKRLWRARYL